MLENFKLLIGATKHRTGVSSKGNDEFIFSYQMISEHVRARSESLQDHQTTAVPCNYNVT